MRTYLVGGAVRDRLLGRAGGDRDFVVVGATPEAMLAAGYKPVGKDFPVFLHPETKEEHALARTERKSGRGYTGFVVHADPSVTLEDDLARRDLTINAIAEDEHGNLVDPFGGARDLEARVLRHVSPAFAEDPVRLLRVARFAARYAPLGFSVAPETMALMRAMVDAGEVDALVAERVWAETKKALAEPVPSAFLRVLRDSGALAKLFPEVDVLYGVPQRAEYHPEVDTGVHVELVCDMAATLAPGDARIGFAALVHDLGKGLTPADVLPKHINHEHAGLPAVRAVCDRYKVPTDYRKLAEATCREHLNVHRVAELKARTVHDLIARCDGFRQPQRIADMALVCEADKRGRAGLQDVPYPPRPLLLALHAAACKVSFADLGLENVEGPGIAEALRKARIAAIARARRDWAAREDGGAPVRASREASSGLTDGEEDPAPDDDEARAIAALDADQLKRVDGVLLSVAQPQWLKVSFVVAQAMDKLEDALPALPDVFYAGRVRALVDAGRLESRGEPRRMRYCEVRRIEADA